MNVHFLVIPCKSVCNGILRRSFLAILDIVTSLIHLKMKYHNDADKLIIISVICMELTSYMKSYNKTSLGPSSH